MRAGSRTYGVSTLLKRHVDVRGSRLRFTFRAKHSTLVRATLVDPELADAIKELISLPGGSRLFRFEDDDRPPQRDGAASERVPRRAPRGRIHGKGLPHVGWEPHGRRRTGGAWPADSESDATRAIAAAMRRVGSELGNTPAVARASYVSPA